MSGITGLYNGDDFLSPLKIGSIGTGFVRTVSPTTSNNWFGNATLDNPYSHNASPSEVLLRTTAYSQSIVPPSTSQPSSMVTLPNLPYPYFQPVPDMGVNPNAMMILSASTQFQRQLQTVGAPAIPGYPVVGFGSNASALDFMGGTDAFQSAVIPYHPRSTGQGAFYPGATGGGFYYPIPPIQAPYTLGPFGATNYPHFAPYFGSNVVPSQIPYPANASSPSNNSTPGTPELAEAIRTNTSQLPGVLPSASISEAFQMIAHFNVLPEGERVHLRQTLSNPTQVNTAILNSTGITSTGGKYAQGKVTNPFVQSGFLSDTNPFARFNSGMVVTDGNGNGKVLGTTERDILLGTQNRNTIVDGRGGEDDILTSSAKDLINVHQGDRVFTDAGDDLAFLDLRQPDLQATRQTVVDGGDGEDTMVLTMSGDPSKATDGPVFRKLWNGMLSVSLNGIQLLTRNVERFIVVDAQGNIGSIYKA